MNLDKNLLRFSNILRISERVRIIGDSVFTCLSLIIERASRGLLRTRHPTMPALQTMKHIKRSKVSLKRLSRLVVRHSLPRRFSIIGNNFLAFFSRILVRTIESWFILLIMKHIDRRKASRKSLHMLRARIERANHRTSLDNKGRRLRSRVIWIIFSYLDFWYLSDFVEA